MPNSPRLLVVEGDDLAREMLAEGLSAVGAEVATAGTGEQALALPDAPVPDAMLIGLRLGGMDGASTLAALRQRYGQTVPAVALSGLASAHDRAFSLAAGFDKHLVKPAQLSDIVSAIEMVRRGRSDDTAQLRSILAAINEAAECRYTSVLRFTDAQTLVSVWTHDRKRPDVDTFPVGLPIEASYCVLVRDSGRPTAIENASIDPRALDHPKRSELQCYVAAPLTAPDGAMLGTLCSYDPIARAVPASVLDLHVRAARRIAPLVSRPAGAPSIV